ncbi:hypothetical protein N7466_010907 [Penicillium verhagenii]|uniref:uncharacterized protein n=1 Tax=Penicillium verhagenii TaxID=1562060 RepID=UPI002545398D|nr:uncharacterized protein N7466_010907 [Penicillium verhagenii]KAJ5917353.1 hypothetical protein N7466_010907 [Penicillium verhagenii]
MSCLSKLKQREDSDSDYGSDFTPDEEDILNQLLTKAVAEHAPAESDATPTSSFATPRLTPGPTIATTQSNYIATTRFGSPQPAVVATSVTDIEDAIVQSPGGRLPKVLGREKPGSPWRSSQRPWEDTKPRSGMAQMANQGADNRATTFGRERERERVAAREQEWTQHEQVAPTLDTRSPVERFRKPPNKAFSVTDLVSPAWCELQYWYTLTKHGRKRRTAAMKKGSSVHKTLEDEVYTTVPVDITTKEDAWALRIWNVIQGLRILRQYGITRELEVWGVVDGELVNGVIDQLSYECPDSELEATAASFYEDAERSRAALPEYQMSLSDFLLSSSQGGRRLADLGQTENVDAEQVPSAQTISPAVYDLPRIYMTDVKTRASRSIPTVKSTSFRPTSLQLQLYYHMLNRMLTSDEVTMELLAARYKLDPERPFSDAFVSEVGGLNDEFFDTLSFQEFDLGESPTPEDARRISHDSGSVVSSSPVPPASQNSTSILLAHGNLFKLWSYMKDQLRFTFMPSISEAEPVAPSIPSHTQPATLEEYSTLLSPVLTARFLSSAQTEDLQPKHLGSRSFLFDPQNMTSYITDQMEWWRGQRDPIGVNIADAWKCRICEFRDDCTWREEREWALDRRNHGRQRTAPPAGI